jgi:hypothetical protein
LRLVVAAAAGSAGDLATASDQPANGQPVRILPRCRFCA